LRHFCKHIGFEVGKPKERICTFQLLA